jgi:uncharacterized protein YraI
MRIAYSLAGAAFLGTLCLPGVAAAATAFTTGNVNMRAGPSTQFPRVASLPEGVTVRVHGCLRQWSWCDTSWRGARGWVSGRYLEQLYRGRRVLVPEYGVSLGLPIISFQFGSYWDRWYSDRSWYRDRPRWQRQWASGDWSSRDDDYALRRPRDFDRYRADQDDFSDAPTRRRARGVDQDDQFDGDRRQDDVDVIVEPRRAQGLGQGMDDDVPPGIRKRGGKACPPGLRRQNRCPAG